MRLWDLVGQIIITLFSWWKWKVQWFFPNMRPRYDIVVLKGSNSSKLNTVINKRIMKCTIPEGTKKLIYNHSEKAERNQSIPPCQTACISHLLTNVILWNCNNITILWLYCYIYKYCILIHNDLHKNNKCYLWK